MSSFDASFAVDYQDARRRFIAIGAHRFTFIALEYGTYSREAVNKAMREESWLYRCGDPLDGTVLVRSRQIIRQTMDDLSR